MFRFRTAAHRQHRRATSHPEQEFFQKLAAADPSYPNEVRDLIDAVKPIGCAPELKRTYVIYAEGPGLFVNLGNINPDGTLSIWGSASRDAQIGRPVGEEYMRTVAGLLPSTDVKDVHADRGAWYVRYKGKSSIPWREILARKAEWIAAIKKFVDVLAQMPA
jgi:hypothetical protein